MREREKERKREREKERKREREKERKREREKERNRAGNGYGTFASYKPFVILH
jgi:hypothetical protein